MRAGYCSKSFSLFSVVFKPNGLSQLFNIPISELCNKTIPLNYVIKTSLNNIENKLSLAVDITEKQHIIEQFLIELRNRREANYNFSRVQYILQIINKQKGIVDINSLSSEACLSRKQFERTFSFNVGLSPKKFLKTIRFQNAIHQKSIYPDISLTELSYLCGYYDQAHMTNEFIKLSGMNPKLFFKQNDLISDYFH